MIQLFRASFPGRAGRVRFFAYGFVSTKRNRLAGKESAEYMEYHSILTALAHLPGRGETDPLKIDERYREKEVIKRRLAALTDQLGAGAANSLSKTWPCSMATKGIQRVSICSINFSRPIVSSRLLAGRRRRNQLSPLLRRQRSGGIEHGES